MERLNAVGVLIGSMEQLSTISNMRDDDILSWRLFRGRFRNQDHPLIRVLDRMMSYPTVAVIPVVRGLAAARLAAGTAFHLANGRFMGLNRFVWAFAGSYPAVAYTSRGLGPATAAGVGR